MARARRRRALAGGAIVGDPGQISRRSTALRAVSLTLITDMALSALVDDQLVDDLLRGGPETSSAADLLLAGSSVWACTVLAISWLNFELDCAVVPRHSSSSGSSSPAT